MRLQNVDLNLFVVFEAVYTERNLTRAAEVLCITQPAVSNALNRLRKSFNDQLFVRTPSGMVPTPVAENIVGRIRQALQLMGSSLAEGDKFEPLRSDKTFVLSMSDLAESILLPPLIKEIQQQAPGVSVECFTIPRTDIAKELAAGSVDLALDIPSVATPQLCSHGLSGDRYMCVVRQDHPRIGDSLTFDEYLSLGHIHVSSRRTGSGYVDIALNRLGRERNIQLRVQTHQAVADIVRNTDLAVTLPLNLAKGMGLKVLELPFSMKAVEWVLYWHTSADKDQANIWIRELVANFFAAKPGA